MVNISSPSWREDAPSAEETSLAQLIGARNPMAAANLMIPEMQRNSQAQDAYHDQIAQNNDIQRQAIAQASQEARLKSLTAIGEHGVPGMLAAIRSMMPDAVPTEANSVALEQGIGQKAAATNLAGFGKASEGGIQINPSLLGPGNTQGTPALVQAAKLNADSRRDAAAIGAAAHGPGSKDFVEFTTTPNMEKPFDTRHERHYGVSNVIPSAGGGGGGGGGGVMPPQAQRDEIDRHVATLSGSARDQVTKAAAANGGVPIVVPVNIGGRVVNRLKGADGKAY
jgi:hypothetical protein